MNIIFSKWFVASKIQFQVQGILFLGMMEVPELCFHSKQLENRTRFLKQWFSEMQHKSKKKRGLVPKRRELGGPYDYPFYCLEEHSRSWCREKRIISRTQQFSWVEDEVRSRDQNSGSLGVTGSCRAELQRVRNYTQYFGDLHTAYVDSLLNAKLHVHSVKLNKVQSVYSLCTVNVQCLVSSKNY